MATQGDVRRIALSLPGTREDRVPDPDVIVVRVGNEIDKQVLIAMDGKVFFTESHYDGYAAVLVHLPLIDVDLLTDVVTEAWRCRASKRLRVEREG